MDKHPSPSREARLTRIQATWPTLAQTRLSALFQMTLHLRLIETRWIEPGQFPGFADQGLGETSVCLGSRQMPMAVTMDPLVESAWADRLTGGRGESSGSPLTEVGRSILVTPLAELATTFAQAWEGATRLVPATTVAGDERFLHFHFLVGWDGQEAPLHVGIPGSSLDPKGDLPASAEAVEGALRNQVEALEKKFEELHRSPIDWPSVELAVNRLRHVDTELLAQEVQELPGADAAALTILLGIEKSAEIFRLLPSEQRSRITFEVARLDTLDSARIGVTLKTFARFIDDVPQFYGGIDLMREVLERAIGSDATVELFNELTDSLQVRPFDFLRRVDPTELTHRLGQEGPQTIALVLSFLGDQAAVVLQGLPPGQQLAVVKRLADLRPVAPETVRRVEIVLERPFGGPPEKEFLVSGGPEAVEELLGLVDRDTEDRLRRGLGAIG